MKTGEKAFNWSDEEIKKRANKEEAYGYGAPSANANIIGGIIGAKANVKKGKY
jgi:hypothetical protein